MTSYGSFLLLAALAQGLHAVQWTGGPQNGDVIYACQGTKVTLPWHLQLGPGDVIRDMEWFYRGLSEELVGVLIHGAFMAYPSFVGRVSYINNAGIILSGLIPADSGNYSVEVTGSNATGHIFELRQLVTVKIFDQLMTKGDALQVSRSAEPVMDNATGSWTIHLLCGFFSFPGKPPYFMEWITPNGVVRNSSSYNRGYFHLPLSGAIPSGKYRCRVPEQHLNDSCLPGRDSAQTEASMVLDGVDARLTLMGKEMEQLSADNKLLWAENHRLMTENSQLFAYLQRLEQQLRDTNLRLDTLTVPKEKTTTETSSTVTNPPTSSTVPKEQTTTETSPTVTSPPTSTTVPKEQTTTETSPTVTSPPTSTTVPKEQTTTETSPTVTSPPTSTTVPKEQTTTETSPTVTNPPTSSTGLVVGEVCSGPSDSSCVSGAQCVDIGGGNYQCLPKEQTATETSPTVTNPPTSSTDDTSGGASCNFESGMCSWTQDKTDNFDWTRHRGSTPSSRTGPSADHTSGNGYYLYIETSLPRRDGDTARLISPTLNGTPRCLSLWYSMYGTGIGNLTVYVRTGVTLGAPVFTRSHDQGRPWLKASVDISSSSPFQVVIEASRGITIQGDIAIDDVSVSSGPCPATRAQRDGLQ